MGLKPGKLCDTFGAEHRLCVPDTRAWRARVQASDKILARARVASDGEIMVTGDHDFAALKHEIETLSRLRRISDSVAKAPDSIASERINLANHCLECWEIRMDVAQQCDHCATA
jgi:hypothetical protein